MLMRMVCRSTARFWQRNGAAVLQVQLLHLITCTELEASVTVAAVVRSGDMRCEWSLLLLWHWCIVVAAETTAAGISVTVAMLAMASLHTRLLCLVAVVHNYYLLLFTPWWVRMSGCCCPRS
jgi:hypothetical protein